MNLGWRAADAEYVFFLHDDTEVEPGRPSVWPRRWMRTPTPPRLARCWWMTPASRRRNWALCRPAASARGRAFGQPAGTGRVSTRRGPHDARVCHSRGSPDRRALRPVRRRCGPGGADPEGIEDHPPRSAARVRHHGSGAYSTLERADFLLGRAVFMGKYLGFGPVCGRGWGRSLARLCRSAGASCATPCRARRSTARNCDCRGRGCPLGRPARMRGYRLHAARATALRRGAE